MKKSFVFLYPINEKFDVAVESYSYGKETPKKFRKRCKEYINEIIDLRYRKKGFQVNYAVYSDTRVSDMIDLKGGDTILNVGLTLNKHKIKVNGEHLYPVDNASILEKLNPDILRIGGFFMWDCVEKLAKRAHERRIDVLVDEDLTEFMFNRVFDKKLDRKKYNPKYILKDKIFTKEKFLEVRRERPWLFNDYK